MAGDAKTEQTPIRVCAQPDTTVQIVRQVGTQVHEYIIKNRAVSHIHYDVSMKEHFTVAILRLSHAC